MDIGGELSSLVKDLNYSSKDELLSELRQLRYEIKHYPTNERKLIEPHLAVAIQQAFYASEYELMKYKNVIAKRSKSGKVKNYCKST